MQHDFHYCGTYVLARLAGFGPDSAKRIATAAQFVDEATENWTIPHPEGPRFTVEPTGHGLFQLRSLNDPDDQIRVWVPFHFLPGGFGDGITSRLICTPDSPIAVKSMEFAIKQSVRPFGMESLGVAAHAYADTFAHFGFCGVSSRLNWVVTDSVKMESGGQYVDPLAEYVRSHPEAGSLPNFRLHPIVSGVAQVLTGALTGALGHAAVSTCPDAPYLRWSYRYTEEQRWGPGTQVTRNNIENYIRACERLHEHLARASNATPVPISEVRDVLERVLRTEGDSTARATAWQQAAASGQFASITEGIPAYEGDKWQDSMRGWASVKDPGYVASDPAYRFLQAATLHRDYVLRDLLPSNGLCLT